MSARFHGHPGPFAGAATAQGALALIEPGRDVHLDLATRHALIWFLNDGGMGWPALALLDDTRGLYRQLADSVPRLPAEAEAARSAREGAAASAARRHDGTGQEHHSGVTGRRARDGPAGCYSPCTPPNPLPPSPSFRSPCHA